MNSEQVFSTKIFKKSIDLLTCPVKNIEKKLKKKVEIKRSIFDIVERKSKDDPIFDERKVKNNATDYYRLRIDCSNLGEGRDVMNTLGEYNCTAVDIIHN